MPRTSCPPTSLVLPAEQSGSLGAGRYLMAQGQGSCNHTESAYCVVEAVQNHAAEQQSSPSLEQRRTARRMCSRSASTPGAWQVWLRREPVFGGRVARFGLESHIARREQTDCARLVPSRTKCECRPFEIDDGVLEATEFV